MPPSRDASTGNGDRPNIVLIMTDQHRADLCAREGYPLDTTPTLDRLAREGVWFDRAYTTSPTCLPARVSMLTGRFPSATRVRSNHNAADATYERDLIDVLRDRGYAVGLSGKNHSHLSADRTDFWAPYGHNRGPAKTDAEQRFDEWLGRQRFYGSIEPAPFTVREQIAYRLVTDAIEWLASLPERPDSNPFFLWLSFPEPHNPYQVPEPYYDMFPPEALPATHAGLDSLAAKGFKYRKTHDMALQAFPEWDRDLPRLRSNYHGMLRMIDDQVARLVEFLHQTGQRDRTCITMVADHGDFVGEYGMMRKGPGVSDFLMRIPMLWNGPGIAPDARPHAAHVSIADVLPTICEMVGADVPAGVQGRSLWPLLAGRDYPAAEFEAAYAEHGFGGLHYCDDDDARDDLADPLQDGMQPGEFFDCLNSRSQSGTLRMFRKGDWKLCYDMMGCGELYNLAVDPAEQHNRFGDPACAAIQTDLLEGLLAWALRAEDPLPAPRRRYVVKRDPRNWYAPHRPGPQS